MRYRNVVVSLIDSVNKSNASRGNGCFITMSNTEKLTIKRKMKENKKDPGSLTTFR